MLEKYLDNQEIITKLLINSLKNNILSQAYLFICDDVDYIYNYAKDFIKEIIKKSNLDKDILNNIYNRIDKDEYTELKVIEPDGQFIKKEQLLELQNSVLNKPVEANKIVYIIKNCEKLNSSSANSILKFLEEPADDIIAILLTDNINAVIPTIKSRCQVLNFKNVNTNVNNTCYLIKNLDIEKDEEEVKILIDSIINFVDNIERKKINSYIYIKDILWDKFKTNDDILILLNFLIYLYMDSLYIKLNKNIKYMNDYKESINLIVEKNSEVNIIKKLNIIESLKNDLRYNVNSKLLFDKLIIELSEV